MLRSETLNLDIAFISGHTANISICSARTRSDRARELFGWRPQKTFEDFKKAIYDEVKYFYAQE